MSIPTTVIKAEDVRGRRLVDVLVEHGIFFKSKREARQCIEQGGLYIMREEEWGNLWQQPR